DQLLDLLGTLTGYHEDGILRLDDDAALEPHDADQAAFRTQVRIPAVDRHHVAHQRVAIPVALAGFEQRGPGTDIAPAGVQRHDGSPLRTLHHGVVDRVLRAPDEGFATESQYTGRMGGGCQ